jgi:hypothetical protein
MRISISGHPFHTSGHPQKNGASENSDRDELWPGRLPKHAPDPQKGLGLFFVFFKKNLLRKKRLLTKGEAFLKI